MDLMAFSYFLTCSHDGPHKQKDKLFENDGCYQGKERSDACSEVQSALQVPSRTELIRWQVSALLQDVSIIKNKLHQLVFSLHLIDLFFNILDENS